MAVAKNKRGGSACPEWWVRMIGTVGQLAAEYTVKRDVAKTVCQAA